MTLNQNKNEDIHVVPLSGEADRYLIKAKEAAVIAFKSYYDEDATADDFYIVWFGKGLQNWKAEIVHRDLDRGIKFEITYNGDRRETYINGYTKTFNRVMVDIPAH